MNTELHHLLSLPNGESLLLRPMQPDDGDRLGAFFDSLSDQTRQRFGPHPLTAEHAIVLCDNLNASHCLRLLAVTNAQQVVGYFICDHRIPLQESKRYHQKGIGLETGQDLVFAPCVADAYQNRGLASAAMPVIIDYFKQQHKRALVLLGGTQQPNHRAVHFYRKFGFVEQGGYQTEVYNLDMWLPLREQK